MPLPWNATSWGHQISSKGALFEYNFNEGKKKKRKKVTHLHYLIIILTRAPQKSHTLDGKY